MATTARGLVARVVAVPVAVIVSLLAVQLVTSGRLTNGCLFGCATISRLQPLGTVLVSRDGLTLVTDGSRPCDGRVSFTATEHPDRVEVALVWTGPDGPPSCGAAALPSATWTLRLTAPLGDRELINAATARPAPWIGGPSLLDPGYLPAGFVLSRTDSHVPQLLDAADGIPCYTRFYAPPSVTSETSLTLAECAGTVVALIPDSHSVHVLGHVAVAGTTAQLRAIGRNSLRGLVWTTEGRSYMVATLDNAAAVPDALLVAVADGLR